MKNLSNIQNQQFNRQYSSDKWDNSHIDLKSGYLINNWVSHDNGSELLSGYNNIYHNTKANTKLMLKFFWQIILKLSTKTQLKTNFITCSFWPFFFKFSLANSDGEGEFSTMNIITTNTNTLHDKKLCKGIFHVMIKTIHLIS